MKHTDQDRKPSKVTQYNSIFIKNKAAIKKHELSHTTQYIRHIQSNKTLIYKKILHLLLL
jgi:hypothetical protein